MDGAHDDEVLAALELDDSWQVQRTLAQSAQGSTELVTSVSDTSAHLYVRKRIALPLADIQVWEALSHIDHPRLPHIHTIYQLPDELVIIYDWIPGTSLAELIAQQAPLPAQTALTYTSQLAQALEVLHAAHIIHRDITPANIIISWDGAHLSDLGIARIHTAEKLHDTRPLGTPDFAAPEQFGFAPTDARSDVYSLGRVLTYMLTSHPVANKSDLSPALSELISHAVAFDRKDRFQTMEEFQQALTPLLNSTSTDNQPAPTTTSSPVPASSQHTTRAASWPGGPSTYKRWPARMGSPHGLWVSLNTLSVLQALLVCIWEFVCLVISVLFIGVGISYFSYSISFESLGSFIISSSIGAFIASTFATELPCAILGIGVWHNTSSRITRILARVILDGLALFVCAAFGSAIAGL